MKMFKGKLELKGDYKLTIGSIGFSVLDSNGNFLYYEEGDYWFKIKYDFNGNEKYYENSKGYLYNKECDPNGNLLYFEDNSGLIIDKRHKKEQ